MFFWTVVSDLPLYLTHSLVLPRSPCVVKIRGYLTIQTLFNTNIVEVCIFQLLHCAMSLSPNTLPFFHPPLTSPTPSVFLG